jgi:hypothetical protein
MPNEHNTASRIDALRFRSATGKQAAMALDELGAAVADVDTNTVDIERLRLSTRVNAKCEQLRNIAALYQACVADLITETLDEMEALRGEGQLEALRRVGAI